MSATEWRLVTLLHDIPDDLPPARSSEAGSTAAPALAGAGDAPQDDGAPAASATPGGPPRLVVPGPRDAPREAPPTLSELQADLIGAIATAGDRRRTDAAAGSPTARAVAAAHSASKHDREEAAAAGATTRKRARRSPDCAWLAQKLRSLDTRAAGAVQGLAIKLQTALSAADTRHAQAIEGLQNEARSHNFEALCFKCFGSSCSPQSELSGLS